MVKILLTAVSGDLGSSTARALHKAGFGVVGVDMERYCPVLNFLEYFHSVPPAVSEAYFPAILKICEAQGISVVLPMSDVEIMAFNTHRRLFSDRNIALAINSPEILKTFFDKLETANFFADLGFTVPKTETWDGKSVPGVGFPLVLKPRSGSGSRHVRVFNTLRDFEEAGPVFQEVEMIAQEHIGSSNEEYTTGVFSGGKETSSITFRRVLGPGGYSKEVHLRDVPFMEEMSRRVADATQLVGSLNIQTRRVCAGGLRSFRGESTAFEYDHVQISGRL
jgi:carbamoyl-phosphate synthase large subunit